MFYADLHVHSKYSRATSQDCDLEHLYYWARKKGISVVGTGDFTHPAWLAEIRGKLVPAEPGLFRLRADLEREMERRLSTAPAGPTRFMLSVEISNIYKRNGKTRKIHNLIYAPDLASAERFAARLERIGNIASDGRPILGLDSRDLLEIALEAGPGCYLVPAHIWTPWFAVLGSKSGFDAVAECYADLASHVFAVETGLSSDPAMNWRLSQLDRYRLVSNSDAHSPPKLGREATVFAAELDYFAMRHALETGEGFGGTIEFFPEEGKYHLDGHRKCEVCLEPSQSNARGGLCPVCKKPLTLGVLHRVEELADCAEGRRPEGAASFDCLVPLPEILSETLQVGPASQKVHAAYERLVQRLGPELQILRHVPLEDIRRESSELLREAVARMRAGKVLRSAGYDGEYGVIRMFEPAELERTRGLALFASDEPRARAARGSGLAEPVPPVTGRSPLEPSEARQQLALLEGARTPAEERRASSSRASRDTMLRGLDPEQREAAAVERGPLLIIAGPGTGKTRTLTHRLAHLIRDRGVAPENCLAITFTRRAADEMRERLRALLGEQARAIDVLTFHALGASILRAHGRRLGLPAELGIASERERVAALRAGLDLPEREAVRMLETVSRQKRTRARASEGSEASQALASYDRHLRAQGLCDFDDLIGLSVELLATDPELCALYRERYRQLSIDEYQDIDELQYALVRLLCPPGGNLCAIGDPDQAIYGFRGADVRFFVDFERDFPGTRTVRLLHNYRSTQNIVDASAQMMGGDTLRSGSPLEAECRDPVKLELHAAPSERAEAEFIAHRIEQLIGGYSFYSVDSGRVDSGTGENHGFADFALLYRTRRQLASLEAALLRAGIPFQRRSHWPLGEEPLVQALLAQLARGESDGPISRRLASAATRVEAADPARLEAVLEMLAPLAERAGADFPRFVADLSSAVEVDTWDPRADRVAMLTLHAAKGLEFDTVFIPGCEDGVLPHHFDGQEPDLAEERRLFYVGMTRARRRLVLSHSRKRVFRGELRAQTPSPFLAGIEPGLLIRSQGRAHAARKRKSQLDLF